MVERGRGGFAAYGYADEAQDYSGILSCAQRHWYTWFFLNVEVTLARECTKPLILLQSRVVGVGSRNFYRGSARVDVLDNVWGDYTLGGGTKGSWERMRARVVRLVICNVCVDVGTYRTSIRYSTSRMRTQRRVA